MRRELGAGVVLGVLYTMYGQVPNWIAGSSMGTITADDDPSNISPRIYLPILKVAMLVAIGIFCLVVIVL